MAYSHGRHDRTLGRPAARRPPRRAALGSAHGDAPARLQGTRDSDWPDVRLHVVTGKGGTGKTTVAARPRARARRRRPAGRCSSRSRAGRASPSSSTRPPLPYEERRSPSAPGGGEVYALAVDPEEALLEYLHMFYKLRAAPGRTLRPDRAPSTSPRPSRPGLRDVLLTGKVKEAVAGRRRAGTPAYDAVVLDAPPTGRIARFLNVNARGRAGSPRSGRSAARRTRHGGAAVAADRRAPGDAARGDAGAGDRSTASPSCARVGLPVGGVVVNMVRAPLLPPSRPAPPPARAARPSTRRRRWARRRPASTRRRRDSSTALLAEAAEHAARVALEERERDGARRARPADVRAAAAARRRRPRRRCYELAELR